MCFLSFAFAVRASNIYITSETVSPYSYYSNQVCYLQKETKRKSK